MAPSYARVDDDDDSSSNSNSKSQISYIVLQAHYFMFGLFSQCKNERKIPNVKGFDETSHYLNLAYSSEV